MPRPRSDGAATRERLLDAAERLFATHGIQGTSLRMINDAAGAKNVSAAHYHFGSKEGVIEALVTRRMGELAEERLANLAAVEAAAGQRAPDVRAAVEAVVLPFLRTLMPPRRTYFATVLARAAGDPSVSVERLAPPAFWRMIERFLMLVHRAHPELPEHVLAVRIRFVLQQALVAVVELDRMAREAPGIDSRTLEVVGHDLVDYVVGGLVAPTSRRRARGGAAAAAARMSRLT